MSERPHILVVDDDRRIRELLQDYLSTNGFRVSSAASAAEARERMRGLVFDLAVMDVMMPGETGLQLVESLRANGQDVPVLVLSALADTEDRINGLSAGGDDYLSKPFEPRELLLRIRNLLRRVGPKDALAAEIHFGDFVFIPDRAELRRNGEVVRLTTREKQFLRALAKRPGEAVSRDDLAQQGLEDSQRSVDVQINRLRRKIEADPANPVHLQTVRGSGYCLIAD